MAQREDMQSWEKYYDEVCDIDEIEASDGEAIYDILCELANNKIDLNKATREDLQQLMFLTDSQIEEICEYAYRYGPVRSFEEMSMIESLDAPRRNLLQYFVYVGEEESNKKFPSLSEIMKHGKSELVATMKIPLYEREGDKNGYLGYKYKHWFRYNFKCGQYVQAGIVGSQDAGEPFFANKNKWGYDYYSFYILIKKLGRLKALAIGRYRLKFGMGLVMNNDFSLGKIASISTINSNNTIRAHSSRTEYNYLQGAAATYNVAGGLDVTGFVSYRKIDATPTNGDSTITTILETGYHRTETEMEHKHNVSRFLVGGNIRFSANGFHAGVTAIHSTLSKELTPNTSQIYRKYYPSGKRFSNVGVDYGYINYKLTIGGETAIDHNGALATINRIIYQPSRTLSVTLLQRFYSYKYSTLFGESFNDGGHMQNESGIYVGINWIPIDNLSIMAYTDYAYFAWPKYQISDASHSWDNFVSASLKKGDFTVSGRYRIRLRQRDNDDDTALISKIEQRARLAVVYERGVLQNKLQVDVSSSNVTSSFGWMLSYNGGLCIKPITAYLGIGYFDTDDYNSRVYMYERSILYSFSYPVFYGNGMRFTANVRADISAKLMLMCKVGTTKYFDRDVISSSYQQINSSSMTDIDLQLRWKF